MKLRLLIYTLFIAVIFGSSCTPYKNVPYYQDLQKDSLAVENIQNYKPLTVQAGDLLGVHVVSMNREADLVFNYNLERPSGISAGSNDVTAAISTENTVYGYLVDSAGYIHMPMVGAINVINKTTTQAAKEIESHLSEYLTKPTVDIRILNFKISVLGDVSKPGNYTIANEKLTINEALALAGDMNTTGLRKNVLLIRETNGKREFIHFDLTSKNTFTSPYYYLKNNDVIYVQPNRQKVTNSDSTIEKISIVISALSVLAIFLTRK